MPLFIPIIYLLAFHTVLFLGSWKTSLFFLFFSDFCMSWETLIGMYYCMREDPIFNKKEKLSLFIF